MNDPIRFAVVGNGKMASDVLRLVARAPGAEVVAGHIADPQISLLNGLRLGSTLSEVLRAYFVAVPLEKVQGVRIVRVVSALDGIICHYSFRDNQLTSIDFDSYSVVDKAL